MTPETKALVEIFKNAGIDLHKVNIEEFAGALKRDVQENYFYYTPHTKQALFHEAGKEAKERLFLAGNRTGKTFGACVEVVMHLTGRYPEWWQGYRYTHPIDAWVASNTSQTTRDILQHQYYLGQAGSAGMIPDHLILKSSKQPGVPDAIDTLFVKHITGGTSTLGFKSYDQGRTKFQGTKKHLIHFDEEPPRSVYHEALLRTMGTGKHHGMLLLTMTPKLGLTEMVLSFIEDRLPEVSQNNKFYVQATWADNPYLQEDEKTRLRASLKPHEVEAVEKGIPSLGIGLVYPVPESHVVTKPFPIPDHWPRVYGLDFGWSNPTAALFAAHDRDNDILYCYSEYAQSEKTPEQHVTALTGREANWIPGVYDPAGKISSQKDGQNLIALYREAGLRYLSKADNAKEKGIMKVLQRMQNGGLKIFSTLSQTLTEFRMYARDDKGIPKKSNDHLMDCLRYIVMSGLPLARAKAQASRRVVSPQPHSWMGG